MSAPLLITCVGVEHDLELLPHFLRHYLRLGVEPGRIRAILNASDPTHPALVDARRILAEHGAPPGEDWIAPYTSDGMWAKRREVQAREAAPDDWVLSADVDEFHEYPEPLADFLRRCARMGVDCAQGPFIDRLAPGGALADVRRTPDIWSQFPLMADVIWSLGRSGASHNRFGTVKLMAMRGRVAPGRGGHGPVPEGGPIEHLFGAPLGEFPLIERPAFRGRIPLRVHHFHWTAKLPARLRRRVATPGASAAGREYGAKQLAHLEAHGGVDVAATGRIAPRPGPFAPMLAALRTEARLRRAAAAILSRGKGR